MGALQETAEVYFVGLFKDTSLCAIYTNQVTIPPQDMLLAHSIWGNKPWN